MGGLGGCTAAGAAAEARLPIPLPGTRPHPPSTPPPPCLAQHLVYLLHRGVGGLAEQGQALLQQTAVAHFGGDEVGLIPVGLLHHAAHVGRLQDLGGRGVLAG